MVGQFTRSTVVTSIEAGTAVAHEVTQVLEEALGIAESSTNKSNATGIAATFVDVGVPRWLVLIVGALLQRILLK